jgi:apolipoprotein N-acyltransferase
VRLRSRLVRQLRYPMRWLSFLASGVPVILIFPAPSLSYLAWFALVPAMALFTRAATTREAVARGWWFGSGYLIAMLYWMAPEIGPGLVLLGFVMGWMWSPFAVAVHKLLRPGASWWRLLAGFIVVPSCWLIPEWMRSYQGLGGPWDLYGASQWQHPAVLALAAVGGVWLISVALLIANAAIVVLLGAIRPSLLLPPAVTAAAQGAAAAGTAGPTAADGVLGDAAAIVDGAAVGDGAASAADAVPEASVTPPGSPAVPAARETQPNAPNAPAARPAGRVTRAAVGVAALVAAAGSGPLAFALTPQFPTERQISVALVQPGTVQDPTARTDASETLTAELSKDGTFGGVKPDLIVWGESSIPDDLTGSSQSDVQLLGQIEALAARDDAEILVNQDTTPPGKGHEKWAVLVNPDGIQGTYAKTRLVPFGEYIPFRSELSWLTSISKAASSNMVSGTGAHALTVTSPTGAFAPLKVGVLICFESAFPDMSRVDTDQGAQLIVYQSATTTFQGTWGPDQHASLAAIRAAETGRPVVQAALTGDTVAFDARGRQIGWLGQSGHSAITVTVDLPAATAKTFYDQAGDYVMWSGVGITGIAALVMLLRRRHFLANTTGAPGRRAAEYDADTGDPVRS